MAMCGFIAFLFKEGVIYKCPYPLSLARSCLSSRLHMLHMLCSVAAVIRFPVHQPLCGLYYIFGPLRSANIF